MHARLGMQEFCYKKKLNFRHSRMLALSYQHLWRTKMWPRVRHQVTNSEPTFGAPHMLGM